MDPRQAAQYDHIAGIALMGEEVLQRDLPPEITSHATCLVVNSSQETSLLRSARLVSNCINLRYLDISVGGISDPTSCIPCALPRLSHLHFFAQQSVTTKQLSGLLRLVPNIESISCVPTTFSLAADSYLQPLRPRRLRHLAVDSKQGAEVLLRSLIVHCWNVRSLLLSVTPAILDVLARAHLAAGLLYATRDVALDIHKSCVRETHALYELLAACDLRRLALRAPAAKAGALLAVVPRAGLRVLALSFVNVGAVDAVRDAVQLLARDMPRALRVLRVSTMRRYAADLEVLNASCRARRIAYRTIDGKWWEM